MCNARDSFTPKALGKQVHIWPFFTWKNMQQWRLHSLAQCPHCQAPLEDKAHIIRCCTPLAAVLWQSSLKSLKQWLSDQHTSPKIQEGLLHGLQAWYQDEPAPPNSPSQPQWFEEQMEIGWHSLLDGWLSLSW